MTNRVYELPKDAMGFQPKAKENPLAYTDAHRQMMKEYNMTEEEFAEEFGGRPHQQRQSPVARSSLMKLKIPISAWDYCVHKYVPMKLCKDAFGGYYFAGTGDAHCQHLHHEYELCTAAELIRQNQVIQIKKRIHSTYDNSERNWLYNDPDWGHLMWRSKYGARSFKAKFMMGGGTRAADPPTHEARMEQLSKYNPDVNHSDPHPSWTYHRVGLGQGVGFKFWWNKAAITAPTYSSHTRHYECTTPFDPLQMDEPGLKPW